MSQLDVQWRALGQHFGYPQCCVEEFLKDCCQTTKDRYPNGPWLGTGYIPCPCCAAKAAGNFDDFVATVIAPVRLAATPFPEEGCDDAIDNAIVAAWDRLTPAQQLWHALTDFADELRFQPRRA
jgi:hypothetical protein